MQARARERVGLQLSPRGLVTTVALSLLAPANARAQAAEPKAQEVEPARARHHVEVLVGPVVAEPETQEEAAVECLGPCVFYPSPEPVPGSGAGHRFGYRIRPLSFFEIGVSMDVDYSKARTFSWPLLAYLHHRTEAGSSLTVGVGGGFTHVRAFGESQTMPILRGEMGAAFPLGRRVSFVLLVQLTRAYDRGFFEPSGRSRGWAQLAIGPRYSF